jgi:hypothetical protein
MRMGDARGEAATTNGRSFRARAYDHNFKKKLGELSDFAGRALVAAGLGGGVVARLAQEKAPTTGLWELAMALFGFGLIYWGIASQAAAGAEKESEDAARPA